MTKQQLYQLFKDMSLRNITDDMNDISNFIFMMNMALIFLYSTVSQKWPRYYNIVTEDVTPDDPNWTIYTLSHNIMFHYEIQDAWGQVFSKRNVSVDMRSEYTEWDIIREYDNRIFSQYSPNQIKLKEHKPTIKIMYARMPERSDIDTNLSWNVDCPREYLGNLLMIILWVLFPQRLENWATLANNYFAQHKEYSETVMRAFGMGNTQTWFTFDSR
jgi:hypothetical protein